jgi:hypothetical protein
MTQWFRFYEGALDDPKVQTLTGDDFKAWVNILCVACRRDGLLPNVRDLAFMLRMDENACQTLVERLVNATLIDRKNGGANGAHYAPHGWAKRQYKSDGSTNRVKRFRERSKPVTETPPDTETDTDTERVTEAKASGASAPVVVVPIDAKSALFTDGLRTLSDITGREINSLRSVVGRWVQLSGNDHASVMGIIETAQAQGVIDPISWISKAMKAKADPDAEIYRNVL